MSKIQIYADGYAALAAQIAAIVGLSADGAVPVALVAGLGQQVASVQAAIAALDTPPVDQIDLPLEPTTVDIVLPVDEPDAIAARAAVPNE